MKLPIVASAFAFAAMASAAEPIKITTPAFREGGAIPVRFTCHGANISPQLEIVRAPSGAKSLALIVDDPDAPSGLFTHWLVWDIDPQKTTFPENSAPAGAAQGTNDFGKRGYGGPCPPSGIHRYFFRVFALNNALNLKAGAKRSELDKAMSGHVIGQGELTGRYGQK
jgi:Raf kinase inhibitor-like YbhB/YbcL family protein